MRKVDKKELKNVIKYIKSVYENLEDHSLLVVSLNGRTEIKKNLAECEANYMQHLNDKESLVDFNDLFKGRCFVTSHLWFQLMTFKNLRKK